MHLLALAWLVSIGGGSLALWRYETTAGAAGPRMDGWPAASKLKREPGKPTLVMLAHPKCACTEASLAGLARIVAQRNDVTVHVVFWEPLNAPPRWREGGNWPEALAIPGALVSADPGGVEREAFGGETSGDVLFFDAEGELLFRGGITGARGEAGPNPGLESLAGMLVGTQRQKRYPPVFGCPLQSPAVKP